MHQAVLASALAIASIVSKNVSGSTSPPPPLRGSSMRNSLASCSAATTSGGSCRSRSIRAAASAMRGARARARARKSSVSGASTTAWLGGEASIRAFPHVARSLWRRAREQARRASRLRLLRAIGLNDLRSERKPELVVRRDVAQRLVEISDTVRHADQEGMQRNPHHAAVAPAFLIEHVEGLADPAMKVLDVDARHVEQRHVVELEGIRNRVEPVVHA